MAASNTSTVIPIAGSWITFILSLSIFAIVLGLFVKRAKFLYPLRNVPSPRAIPIIGNAYQLNCTLEELFKRLIKWGKQFGDIYILWLGFRPLVFVSRVEGVQPLLSSSIHIDKSLEYQYLKRWLGNGLVLSTGDKWHSQRKLLTPTFHGGLQQDYLKSVIREAATMVSCLQTEIGKVFDIVPYAKRAGVDMICESSMGYHINAQTNFLNDYVKAVEKMTSIIQMRFTNIWISLDPIFQRTTLGKEHEEALKIIHGFVDNVIADRKAEWKVNHDGNFNESSTKKKALLDLLLDYSQNSAVGLSDMDIRDQVNTFMFAGHDTVATSISWILYILGHNCEYQDKILEEYELIVGDDELTLDKLNKLTWLEACVKETWRMYPVVPLIARQIYQPVKLMNYDIPIGSTVLVNTFMLHRDPRHFPQPENFIPERFLPNTPKPAAFTYIPFSAGSRNCIGWKFATMVVKVSIISLLRAYKFQSIDNPNDLRLISSIVLINANGVRLRISPRRTIHSHSQSDNKFDGTSSESDKTKND